MTKREAAGDHSGADGNLARSVAINTLWGSAGRIAGAFFAFLSILFLTRALGPETYGQYATVLAFLYLFNAIADGGFYNILARDISRSDNPSRLVATALTLRLILLAASLGVGTLLFSLIPKYHHFAEAAPLAALSYAALSLAQLMMAVLQKHLLVKRAAQAELLARALQLIALVSLYRTHVHSLLAFLGVLAVTSIVQLFLVMRAAHKATPLRFGTTRNDAAVMMRESFPVALALLFTTIYFRLDTVLLSFFKGSGDVGIYNLSYKILEQLIFFPAMFIGVMTPILSGAFLNERERFHRLFAKASQLIMFAALPLLSGGLVVAQQLVILLGGTSFEAAAEPMRVLLGATFLIFFGTLLGTSVIVVGRQRMALFVYGGAMLINLLGNILLIPRISYMGAAWTTLLTEAFVDLGLALILWRIGVKFTVPRFWRMVFATAIMLAPLLGIADAAAMRFGTASLLITIPVAAIVYFAATFSVRSITLQELTLFRKPETR